MYNINPEQLFHYFNNTLSYEKAKKLTSVTIAKCIFYITVEIVGHNKNLTAIVLNIKYVRP